MTRSRHSVFVLAIVLAAATLARAQAPSAPSAPAAPGQPASAQVVNELLQALAYGVQRFQAMDAEGLLLQISERYRSGPLTKNVARQQLRAIFAAHDAVWARIRVDQVVMIGDRAWVYSTGEVVGRVRFLGTHVTLYAWERQPEVAYVEEGRWKLIGDR
ncbi:MAG: hypothetical protein HYU41_07635 [Candidatus Rokubacteria bacterium]|nr:hypothetical protein [Candidatus Rokubacteria bacterium]